MKKFIAALKRAPKRSASIVMIAAAVIIPAALFAWGPDRPNIDAKTGADHVVFNSMTNNPNYGNERQFITVQDPQTGDFKNSVTVEPGKEYTIRVLAHNDANPEAHPDKDLTAINTTLKTVVSTKTGKQSAITAFLNADNAQPKQVYADVFFNSDKEFNLAYIGGSARVYNNGYAAGGEGKPFSDSMVTSAGAKLGYATEGDGKIPGCFEYINYVYFKVKPQFAAKPDFAVEKKVSETGKNSWKDSLATTPGQTVDYRIEYKNTGEVQQDDVVVKDVLPKGVTYVAGSSKLFNSQNTQGKALSDNIITANGVNIGSHAPGANSFVIFQAKVAAADKLEKCGTNTLINKASVETDYGTKDDTADVTVNKDCTPPPVKNIQVCDLTTKKVITIDEKNFDSTKHSKNLDDCKPPVVKNIQVCELATKKIVTIDEKNFDDSKHSKDLKDCAVVNKIQVCELATKNVITIDEKDFDDSKHSKNLDDCKPPVVVNIEVCELATKTVITIDEKDFDDSKHSKTLSDCDETPVTPPVVETPPVTELPKTGAGDLMSLLGAGSLIAAIGYYVASRRTL